MQKSARAVNSVCVCVVHYRLQSSNCCLLSSHFLFIESVSKLGSVTNSYNITHVVCLHSCAAANHVMECSMFPVP